MILTGALVNLAVILCGGLLGTLLKKGMPERISQTVLHGMALCVIYIGLSDLVSYATEYSAREDVSSYHILIPILSMAIGAAIGELIDIDKQMNRLGTALQKKMQGKGNERFAEGFSSATILFCVGAMAIIGSLRSGLFCDHQILIAKSVIDGITALVLASTLGVGVALSAVPTFLYEAILTVIFYFAGQAVLGSGAEAAEALAAAPAINEMTCVGALIIVAIGCNMLGVAKVRVANLIPALLLPFLLCIFI